MLYLIFLLAYVCGTILIIGLFPVKMESRPTLQTLKFGAAQEKRGAKIFAQIRKLAKLNAPLCSPSYRSRIVRELNIGQLEITAEEFLLIKEVLLAAVLFLTFPSIQPGMIIGWLCIGFTVGYMGPEFWLKARIKKIKNSIVKELPDAIDLLGLCVNAGLDFMLSLKWVVEKSPPTVMVSELNNLLQEINVGKTRRDAIRDLALKYQLTDLSTFSRTLIQADKMGTSVTEAFNILSEDMRIARYRRGEQMALKSPLKMLVPLLLFIFPVVGALVVSPIFLDFLENNPFKGLQ